MTWILQRLPSLQHLSLSSLDWTGPVSALTAASLTSLTSLSLDSVTGLNDAALSQLLRPRDDTKKCSLAGLRSLDLSRTSISDISLRYIAQNLVQLRHLRLSACDKLTEAGLTQIGDTSLHLSKSLQSLDISQCPNIKDLSPLSACENLTRINLSSSGSGVLTIMYSV